MAAREEPRAARLVLLAGLVVYLAVQGAFVWRPLWSRALPPEVDDTYVYLVKAAEFESCFFQDCPALEDLRTQVRAPSDDLEVAWQRYRAYVRAFVVYHPLFSALLLAVKALGATWETAYRLIWSAGPPLFGLTFACWLSTLWGPGPAGIALVLMAFHVFPGQGLHYVIPSNLALGIATLVWARIVARAGRAPWTLTIGSLLIALMHPVGRIYALVAVVLALLLGGVPRTRRAAAPLLVTIGVIALTFVAPLVITRPELAIPPEPSDRPWLDIARDLVLNIRLTVDRFAHSFGPTLIVFGLVTFGFMSTETARRNTLWKVGLVLASILILSLGVVLPRYPAELFHRLWVPFSVVLVGAMGQALWYAIVSVVRFRAPASWSIRAPAATGWLVSIVVAALVVGIVVKTAAEGRKAIESKMTYMTTRHSGIALDPAQPALLLSMARATDRVLYLHEIPMFFFFTRGAMALRTSYLIPIAGTPEEAAWVDRPDLRFAVTWNPLRIFAPSWEGMIPATSLEALRVEVSGPRFGPIRVLVDNRGREARISAVALSARGEPLVGTAHEASAGARSSGWLALDPTGELGGRFQITFAGDTRQLFVAGLALGDDQRRWPWLGKARLTLVPREHGGTPTVLSFDPDELLPPSVRRARLKVLDDRGSSVLVQIER